MNTKETKPSECEHKDDEILKDDSNIEHDYYEGCAYLQYHYDRILKNGGKL